MTKDFVLEYDKNQTAMRESQGRQLDSKVGQLSMSMNTSYTSTLLAYIHPFLCVYDTYTYVGTNNGQIT